MMRFVTPLLIAVIGLAGVPAAPQMVRATGCPVELSKGSGARDKISFTLKNIGVQAIKEITFECKLVDAKAGKPEHAHCYEKDANFMPNLEYTLSYAFNGGVSGAALVTVKSIVLQDGGKWKATPDTECKPLKILPQP